MFLKDFEQLIVECTPPPNQNFGDTFWVFIKNILNLIVLK